VINIAWSNSRALLAATALVLVSNAIALAGVAYNRHGEPESVFELTERELPIQFWSWPDNENSAVHLELSWRIGFESDDWSRVAVEWLTREQLQRLGFEMPAADATLEEQERHIGQAAREVFLVLEFDGPAYRASIERARNRLRDAEVALATKSTDEMLVARARSAKAELEDEQRRSSRLFVVAADLDADALRKRYPDRKHYAIVRGRVALSNGRYLLPRIEGIDTDTIRVPHAHRAIVERYLGDRSYERHEPRYAATVNFGRRLEPWIVQLSRM
jgi:hypothetical protein